MTNSLYWVITLLCAIPLAFILINDLKTSQAVNKADRKFRALLIWVIYFCLQDTVWGLCESHIIPGDVPFFISSTVFHISAVATTMFWMSYIFAFLGDSLKHHRFYMFLGGCIILFEIVLAVMNFFTPTLFSIQNGEYHVEHLRILTFVNHYVVYVLIGLIALIYAIVGDRTKRRKYLMVFFFSLSTIILGVAQVLFPHAPYYSVGYFLGCFIIYMFIVSREREIASRNEIISSVADIYYSMHLFDLEKDTAARYVESPILTKLIANHHKPQDMINVVMRGTVCEEYLEDVLEFVNLSTLSTRLYGKKSIAMEFVGRNFGWTRVSFVATEWKGDTLVKTMVMTQVVDEEKRAQMELLYRSNNDELTGVYNRNAYKKETEKYLTQPIEDDLAYISMDVNGLKTINDTLGHAAGDELLQGATECMRRTLAFYGKIFRMGGDEFVALLHIEPAQLDEVMARFKQMVKDWKGTQITQMAVSVGCVTAAEADEPTLKELCERADKKMYEAKSKYYSKQGMDRRGVRDAHTALCKLYTKILKINLTEDTFQIVNLEESERGKEKSLNHQKISAWLIDFANMGQVHPEDVNQYLADVDMERLKTYFAQGNTIYRTFYRRKAGDEYKQVMMEIILANDYSEENQSLFLYVKNIDEDIH